jgi:hypothetical protein
MGEPLFNLEDPWHAYAHLLGGFDCKICGRFLTWNDEMMKGFHDEKDEFLRGCVAVSAWARARGWKLVEEWQFACPVCATHGPNNDIAVRDAP